MSLQARKTSILLVWATTIALIIAIAPLAQAQQASKITEIAVIGNKNISTEQVMKSISLEAGSEYSEQAVEQVRKAVMASGYFSSATVRKDEAHDGVKITFQVVENPKIKSIRIKDSSPALPSDIAKLMKSKVGEVLNTNTLNEDIQAIQNYYQDEGYIAFVTSCVGVDPKTGVLTVPILIHTVEKLEIRGLHKTSQATLLNEMGTQPGTLFNMRTLKEDIVRIYNLGILSDIQPYQVKPGTKLGLVQIILPVVEK